MSIVIQLAEPAEEPARSVQPGEELPRRATWLRVPSYPRGLWLAFLKSRAAPWVGKLLTLSLFLLAALPDAGFKVDKYAFLGALFVLFVATEAFRQAVVKTGQNSYRQAAVAVGYIIGAFAAKLAGGTTVSGRGFFRSPGDAVGIMLRRAKEYVAEALKVPEGEILAAALLVPEHDASGAIVALEEAQHDDLRPGRHGIRFLLSLPGAAQAFRRAVPVALPDSRAEPFGQSFGRTHRRHTFRSTSASRGSMHSWWRSCRSIPPSRTGSAGAR